MVSFCDSLGIGALLDAGPDVLEDFRRTRSIDAVTWKVERQMLVTFFGYCVRRKWITTNPAKELNAPRNLKLNEVVPYKFQEENLILEACSRFGRRQMQSVAARGYEQLRARAMVMLLRHTALRISDVSTLRERRRLEG